MTKRWQLAASALIALVLLATAYNGVVEGLNATHAASTPGQRVATVTQLVYGVFAALALVGVAMRHPATTVVLVGWAIAVVATAGLAPVVYGGTSVTIGVATSVAAAVIAGGVIASWRRIAGSREHSVPPRPKAGPSGALDS
jgi:hypothetical protein